MVYGMTDLTWHQTIHAFLASDQTSRLGCMIYIGPGISLVLDLTSGLKADKPYRSDQARISDTGVLRNVLSCRSLRKMHAFPAMQAFGLSY